MDEHPRALSPVEVAFQRLQRGYLRFPEDRQLPEPPGIQVPKSSHQKWRAVLGEDEGVTGSPETLYAEIVAKNHITKVSQVIAHLREIWYNPKSVVRLNWV